MEPTVAITGATSGIGRAVAEAFVDEGVRRRRLRTRRRRG